MRKAFNELRARWDDVLATGRCETSELSECSYASTPLVTHGAWRGHTFASAAMHTFYKQHIMAFLQEMECIKSQPQLLRQRNRGRKSKKTAYLMDLLARLKHLHGAIEQSGEFGMLASWGDAMDKA
jgi:hypothetical protein